MGVPASEVGYTLTTTGRGDHEVHKRRVVVTTIVRRVGVIAKSDYCISFVAGLLTSSQHPEGPATGHLGTGSSWFPFV
jgi:hypothetical protein